jgi:uncharacterized iron-regulated protein
LKKKINYNIIFYIVMVTLIFCKSNENEFIGKIFNSRNNNIISFEKLINQMKNMDVIYLGEKHDNTEHHQYQIDIIQSLISEGISPIIGFEFFYQHQTSDLMKYVKGIKSPFQHEEENLAKDEEQLREKLGWQNKKDEDWSFYFDLIKLAKDNDLTVFGSDLPSGIVSRISREGLDSLTPVELNQIFSSNFNDNNYQQLMVKKFKESHCGWVPKDDFEKLYHTWVARNDAMAISIVKMLELNQPVVMIVGGGHVEHNMGIYDRVEYFNSKLNQLNLGFKEISIEKSSLSDYFESPVIHGFKYLPKHEYFWFTNRKADKDPCEGFNF